MQFCPYPFFKTPLKSPNLATTLKTRPFAIAFFAIFYFFSLKFAEKNTPIHDENRRVLGFSGKSRLRKFGKTLEHIGAPKFTQKIKKFFKKKIFLEKSKKRKKKKIFFVCKKHEDFFLVFFYSQLKISPSSL